MPEWIVGADPEFFLKRGRSYVSAHDLLPGTKTDPFVVDDGAIQVDGTAVEYNINPAHSVKEFVNNNLSVLSTIRGMLPEEYKFEFRPHVLYRKDYFDGLPDYSKLLGCEPDFCAYTSEHNPTPNAKGTMRTAAGHIHIGWTKDKDVTDIGHIRDCRLVCQALDQTLFRSSLVWDGDVKRRRMYGMKGAFRPKPYGVEYRSLSCKWLESPELMSFVYDVVQFMMNRVYTGFLPNTYSHTGSSKYDADYYKGQSVRAHSILSMRTKHQGYPKQPLQHMCTTFQDKLERGGNVNG